MMTVETISVWVIFAIGLVMGSFLGVLIDRLPRNQTLLGRSICDYCGKVLQPLMMVPVLSYIISRGLSSCCKKKISAFYPGFELLTGIVYVLVFVWYKSHFGIFITNMNAVLAFVAYISIVSALLVILFADMRYHIIPDEMNIVLFVSAFFIGGRLTNLTILFDFLVAGMFLGGLMFLLFYITKGKGLGFGDVKFAFVMGFLLGIWQGLIALYIAFVVGGIISSILLLSRARGVRSKIAFGPFLILGTVVMIFYGTNVVNFIDNLFF